MIIKLLTQVFTTSIRTKSFNCLTKDTDGGAHNGDAESEMADVQRRRGPLPPPPERGLPPPLPAKPATPHLEPVDREKTCPLLLRVFTKVGSHHTECDFAVRGKEPKDEVQIYTWMDATLRELTDLVREVAPSVKEVAPEARRRDAMLSFAFVYPDKRGRFVVREIGDYLNVAVLTQ